MMRTRSFSYWLFLTPVLVSLFLVVLVPLGLGVYYSFTDWNGIQTTAFVGFQNYIDIFQEEEFLDALEDTESKAVNRNITVATGYAAHKLLSNLCKKAEEKFDGLKINVVKIKNDFFGDTVTVAGLITGADFKAQLKNLDLGDELLIPRVSLRNEGDKFLDDVTIEELSEELNVKVTPVENDGAVFLDMILNGGAR